MHIKCPVVSAEMHSEQPLDSPEFDVTKARDGRWR